jgi:hypothetical protein
MRHTRLPKKIEMFERDDFIILLLSRTTVGNFRLGERVVRLLWSQSSYVIDELCHEFEDPHDDVSSSLAEHATSPRL